MSKLSIKILKFRPFQLLLLTRALAILAYQSQSVIVGWQIYSLTGSVFLLGLTGLFEAVPAIVMGFFAGAIVDMKGARISYALSIGLSVLSNIVLLVIAGGLFSVSHTIIVAIIFSGVFISGIVRSFIRPSSSAMISAIFTKEDMPAAMAVRSSIFQIATISGPILAGLVYGFSGVRAAWALTAGLAVLSFISALFLQPDSVREAKAEKETVVQSALLGWKFIFSNQVILSVMALDMFAVLFGGVTAMLPAYADQVLHVGAEGLGVLRSATAVGAIMTALYLSFFPLRYLSAKHLMLVIVGFGLCMIGFGLSKIFVLSVFFLALSGVLDGVSVIIRQTLVQILTPQDMMGRVSSINGIFITSSNEIGAFESGTAASILGLVPSVVFGGIMTLGIVATTAILAPKFRRTVIDTETH